jgi:two-component system response regulator AdeR
MLFGRKKPEAPARVQVVIVDDEEDLCHCMRMALEHNEIICADAHDGEAGLALIRELQPQLVLLDIKMPRKNGYQVLAEMQRDPTLAAMPVIVMTSLGEDADKTDEQWAQSLGVCEFISKPFNPEEVADRVVARLRAGVIQ